MYILPMTEHETLNNNTIKLADFEDKDKEKDTKEAEAHFNASAPVQNDISKLKYVGPSTTERLLRRGFDTIERIAHSTVAQVSEIEGIGEKTAQKIIESAKSCTTLKTLNEYSHAEESEIPEYIEQKVDFEVDEENLEDEIEPDENPTKPIPWFEEKYKISRLGKSYPHPRRSTKKPMDSTLVQEKVVVEPPVDREEDSSHEMTPELPERQILPEMIAQPHSEKTDMDKKQELLTRLHSELKSLEYHILPHLETMSTGVDVIAVKQITINELTELLLILPIRVSSFTGTLKVSQTHIDYEDTAHNDAISINKVITTYIANLYSRSQNILKDLMNKGRWFENLTHFLQCDMSVERSLIFKKVLFRNGPVHYKILLEPLLVCHGTVGFLDKVIPFAYQKATNIHIIEIAHLSHLLEFIERKYSLIEEFSNSEDVAADYDDARNDFIEKIRFFSFPIFCFGFVSLLAILFQAFFLLGLIKTLGYCIVSTYTVAIALLYCRYLQIKSSLFEKASLPYYQHEFDDSTLLLIGEQLSSELMVQFSYECVDISTETPIITRFEQDHAEDLYTKNKEREVLTKDKFFEGQSLHKKDYIRKYSSFLEE